MTVIRHDGLGIDTNGKDITAFAVDYLQAIDGNAHRFLVSKSISQSKGPAYTARNVGIVGG